MSADLPPSSQASSSNEAGASLPDQAQQSTSSPSPAHLLDVLERLSDGDDRLLGHVTLPGRSRNGHGVGQVAGRVDADPLRPGGGR